MSCSIQKVIHTNQSVTFMPKSFETPSMPARLCLLLFPAGTNNTKVENTATIQNKTPKYSKVKIFLKIKN